MIDGTNTYDVYASKTSGSGSTSNTKATSSSSSKESNGFASLDAEDFFSLLIQKMQNQDPLEPMDDSEFISQITQFTTLEKMNSITSAVELMAAAQASSTNAQAVDMIGKSVVTEGNVISLTGEGGTKLKYSLGDNTTETTLTIYDQDGDVVMTKKLGSLGSGDHSYQWDGKDSKGNAVDTGIYRYEISAKKADTAVDVTTYSIFSIDGVDFSGSSVLLKSGEIEIPVSEVQEIFQ